MKIAVVIPTADETKWPGSESIPLTRKTVAHLDAEVVVIKSSGPDFNFSKSVNAGLRAIPDADAWVLLNDDCMMDEGWLDSMLAAAEAHPAAGIVGAVLRFPDGSIQHAGAYVSSGWGDVRLFFRLAIMALVNHAPKWAIKQVITGTMQMPGHIYRLSRFTRLDMVTAACVLITRRCLETVGFFNPEYFLGFEDGDYCLRAREQGFDIVLAQDVTGVHHESVSISRLNLDYMRDGSYHVFCANWPFARIKTALAASRGIIHPKYCEHKLKRRSRDRGS